MKAKAASVQDYLDQLPEDRRVVITRVRSLVRKHLPKGYEESFNWGAITWAVPLSELPDTYNGQPLCYAALAAQKNYNSLYLMGPYGDAKQRARLEAGFKKAGKKLDMGKSCVHFQTLEDLPLDTIAEIIAGVPVKRYIAAYRSTRGSKPKRPSPGRKGAPA